MSYTRYPAVAGRFYPDNPQVLTEMVDGYLAKAASPDKAQNLRVVVAPHAGYIYSGPVAGYSYRQLESLDPKTHWKIFILGPSHRYPLRGVSVCAFDQYQTPLGMIPVSPLAKELAEKLGFIPEADLMEHSLEVQLPFLQRALKSFEIIPIVIGAAPPKQLAQILLPYSQQADVLFVISTDLSHYHSYEEARRIDAIANHAIPALDFQEMADKGDACGMIGVLTAIEIARIEGWQGHFLDYRNSGDTAGPRDQVVGYGAYSFTAPVQN
ncbi:AmmeMemoRadiSam system protein B [bacterium (Candidatus Blackallbacteria) CG17_big_fil_post_rev_8_21_14_2_50_48_46]|uniref:MEMO1 family protein COW36_20460 n=1 Tax=bacterium (Candidatus Blackallbacteria) CG17_big_fil_post_rev_8_21_14_2_50_48_46 TaxID=2014261 RepID=A0A2M7FZS4_9BACT|nr:MAG: AmmeMemoRadiSam system protein B [bacterium (Candidatus Blackallbacteria) CG18_big_fil_WC_8_21_14_2_50_49_26]PIW14778.1 MAG: AmmeMemoRadiSam system protein B [bacterium (Candidatus Blackallbacteria) CG17_big_fil_post_rev_8_21_14_2_50_48_46]PIW50880.1 MAG: AmmeMemoRadiSam system protein B [bacterium (Candidatus Blackallbacteria) CG13_big_fil_rev_8_21_14_2_50_49_14]